MRKLINIIKTIWYLIKAIWDLIKIIIEIIIKVIVGDKVLTRVEIIKEIKRGYKDESKTI